jgi:hypothetical protein
MFPDSTSCVVDDFVELPPELNPEQAVRQSSNAIRVRNAKLYCWQFPARRSALELIFTVTSRMGVQETLQFQGVLEVTVDRP